MKIIIKHKNHAINNQVHAIKSLRTFVGKKPSSHHAHGEMLYKLGLKEAKEIIDNLMFTYIEYMVESDCEYIDPLIISGFAVAGFSCTLVDENDKSRYVNELKSIAIQAVESNRFDIASDILNFIAEIDKKYSQ